MKDSMLWTFGFHISLKTKGKTPMPQKWFTNEFKWKELYLVLIKVFVFWANVAILTTLIPFLPSFSKFLKLGYTLSTKYDRVELIKTYLKFSHNVSYVVAY
jgi:hypothetical protein